MNFSQYSAADMENFGDILYPISMMAYAESLGYRLDQNFSFLSGLSLLGAKYKTSPIVRLFEKKEIVDRLVIGGGDIMRLDDDVVAGHYRSFFEKPKLNFARQDPWAKPSKSAAQVFKEQHMPPVRGAFLLSRENCPSLSRVGYFSCGVPFCFKNTHEANYVRTILDKANYIYVRDEISAQKLLSTGLKTPVTAAPDFLIGIRHLYPASSLVQLVDELVGFDVEKCAQKYLVFQGSMAILPYLSIVENILSAYSNDTGVNVVLLPLGFCHGDRETMNQLAILSKNKFRVARDGVQNPGQARMA